MCNARKMNQDSDYGMRCPRNQNHMIVANEKNRYDLRGESVLFCKRCLIFFYENKPGIINDFEDDAFLQDQYAKRYIAENPDSIG